MRDCPSRPSNATCCRRHSRSTTGIRRRPQRISTSRAAPCSIACRSSGSKSRDQRPPGRGRPRFGSDVAVRSFRRGNTVQPGCQLSGELATVTASDHPLSRTSSAFRLRTSAFYRVWPILPTRRAWCSHVDERARGDRGCHGRSRRRARSDDGRCRPRSDGASVARRDHSVGGRFPLLCVERTIQIRGERKQSLLPGVPRRRSRLVQDRSRFENDPQTLVCSCSMRPTIVIRATCIRPLVPLGRANLRTFWAPSSGDTCW